MSGCLFCNSNGPFSTVEHVIPESLGNDDLLLRDEVCDVCQRYFGTQIEQFVLDKTPIAFWRTFFRIKNKKRRYPSVDISQPKRQKGLYPAVHESHDNIGFSAHEDGSISVEINDPDLIKELLDGKRTNFRLVFTPKVLHMLGRFFCKVGIEILCLNDNQQARSHPLAAAAKYARFGDSDELWPVFHFSNGSLQDVKRFTADGSELIEEVVCYSYSVLEVGQQYLLFHFCMGTDNWIICLNDPYPAPIIQNAFPENKLNLLWYPKEDWKKQASKEIGQAEIISKDKSSLNPEELYK